MNFLEPSALDRIGIWARRLPRAWAAALAVLTMLAALQSARLLETERSAAELRTARDGVVTRLKDVERRASDLRTRVTLLRAALDVRRATARRAAEIAAIGNALPQMVALTAVRQNGDAWQIEGRGPQLSDVRTALVRLEVGRVRSRILDVRRDVRGDVVSFELELDKR